MKAKQKMILYVDDDPDDREFLFQAIKEVNPDIEMAFAENGLEALEYLHAVKGKQEALPCLIVLDINMPVLDGRETFCRLKKDVLLQTVPVIVFSSSEKPADKAEFNSKGIEYFTKPTNVSYLKDIASHMVGICC